MPSHSAPQKPGRPKQHPIDLVRTQVWFYAVKAISGLPSAHAIELALEPIPSGHSSDGVMRPRKWYAYQAGTKVPSKITGKPYSVEIAEKRFPGTQAYFDSPIWSVLRGDPVDLRWVNSQLQNLSPEITEILVITKNGNQQSIPEPLRFREFDRVEAARLADVGTFEALGALVLLIKKSELISSPPLRNLAFEAYYLSQPWLKNLPELAPIASMLFDTIDLTCKQWIFPSPERRLEVVIFSQEFNRQTTQVDSPDMDSDNPFPNFRRTR